MTSLTTVWTSTRPSPCRWYPGSTRLTISWTASGDTGLVGKASERGT